MRAALAEVRRALRRARRRRGSAPRSRMQVTS
jgi:hypothetical protein